MGRNLQRWAVTAVMAAATQVATNGWAQDVVTAPASHAHVRSTTPEIAAAVERASQESPTFRRLVEMIQQSDSYVYVREGDCGHVARACFVSVTAGGDHRLMIVSVDVRRRDLDLMASIGHELRHTLEVIADPAIRDDSAKFFFYERIGFHTMSGGHETTAAMAAGDSIRSELRKARR